MVKYGKIFEEMISKKVYGIRVEYVLYGNSLFILLEIFCPIILEYPMYRALFSGKGFEATTDWNLRQYGSFL